MYLLPITLICTGVIPFRYHYHVLIAMAVMAAFLSWHAGHTLASRGLRADNLRASLKLNSIFMLAAILTLVTVNHFLPIRRLPNTPSLAFDVFYVLISCPAQEFLFRSFLWAELQSARCSSRALEFAVLVIPYTLIHLIYRDAITLLLTFAAGACWYFIYRRAPNWWGVTLAHAAAGVGMIACGLI